MVNQQLLDYIKQQIQQGTSNEKIKQSLITNGWQTVDIEEAFNSINQPIQGQPVSSFSNKSPVSAWKVVAASLIGVAVIGGGIYFASKTLFKSGETLKAAIVFADKLSSCIKYKTTFKHPLTGDMLEKEILGVINGKCNYVEQMPNGGKMECKYSESERVAVAQYYKDSATAESAGLSLSVDLGSGEKKTTYTINGKVVDNPLQELTDSGICVISGY